MCVAVLEEHESAITQDRHVGCGGAIQPHGTSVANWAEIQSSLVFPSWHPRAPGVQRAGSPSLPQALSRPIIVHDRPVSPSPRRSPALPPPAMTQFGDFQKLCQTVPSYPWCNLFYRQVGGFAAVML